VNTDGRFPFNRPTALATLYLGNTQTEMHMIGIAWPSTNSCPFGHRVPGGSFRYLPKRAKDCLLAIFWYDTNVVSAIPPDMALVLPFAHMCFSFAWPCGSMWRNHISRPHQRWNARAFRVSPPEAVAYPWELRTSWCSVHTLAGRPSLGRVMAEAGGSLPRRAGAAPPAGRTRMPPC